MRCSNIIHASLAESVISIVTEYDVKYIKNYAQNFLHLFVTITKFPIKLIHKVYSY